MSSTLTIETYLQGKVRNITIPDEAMLSILADAGLEEGTLYSDASTQEREVALAWLYVWIAGSPTQYGGYSEEDADWRSTDNGERMSASVLKNYLAMANAIFEKYDLDTISTGRWGVVGHGIRNPRNYNYKYVKYNV